MGRISQAINAVYFTADKIQNPIWNITFNDYVKAVKDWEMTSGMIGSQLRAYFPDSKLENEWNNYSQIMNDVLNLVPNFNSTCLRIGHMQEIQRFLSVGASEINNAETKRCIGKPLSEGYGDVVQNIQKSNFHTNARDINWNNFILSHLRIPPPYAFIHSWNKLKGIMIDQKDNLIQEILNSHIATF